MNQTTSDDAWLFADAEAWREFGEAYAAEFDVDDLAVADPILGTRSVGATPNSRGRKPQRARTPRLVMVGGA
ncbi:MAG: hypothetical protein ACSLFN_00470 [Candidatus Limnocylindrales bacterium]